MKIKTTKGKAVLTVVIVTVTLSALLISQADAEVSTGSSFDQRVEQAIESGGTVKTWYQSQWELHKYVDTMLPKKYPFCYAPWTSYLAISKYVEVGSDNKQNEIRIDEKLYTSIIDEAEENRTTAKAILKDIGAKGTGWSAYKKIHAYMQDSEYITGIKSAKGFFENHGGDCASYTSAMYVLCKVQGIPVRWCMGRHGAGLHAYNRIKIGKWYWVDETRNFAPQRRMYVDNSTPMEMW